jgi:putative membrane protein
MFYDGYHFAGMHTIPGQRWKMYSALDILQKRFASGELTLEEYNEKKKVLEKDSAS